MMKMPQPVMTVPLRPIQLCVVLVTGSLNFRGRRTHSATSPAMIAPKKVPAERMETIREVVDELNPNPASALVWPGAGYG